MLQTRDGKIIKEVGSWERQFVKEDDDKPAIRDLNCQKKDLPKGIYYDSHIHNYRVRYFTDGKARIKTFSIKKEGWEKALKKAIQFLEDQNGGS